MDDELQALDPGTRVAVALADVEARQLEHGRVGTEHLLLGLLAEGQSRAAEALFAAGIGLAGTRLKVAEAVGTSAAAEAVSAQPLSRSARATRAIGRSLRFARARKAALVAGEDLLLGVLDVEGTAGQVLRGLGVDLDRLRSTLADGTGSSSSGTASGSAVPVPSPRCPSCQADLTRELTHRVVASRDDHGATRDVVALSCGACGRLLGVTPT